MKVKKEYIIKVLTERIEKITGKKIALQESKKEELNEVALNSHEFIISLLRKYIRKNKLQGVFRIIRHNNIIALDYEKKIKINLKPLADFLFTRGFKQLADRNIKSKIYLQFKNEYNYIVLIEKSI